jgi:Tfp pilus assembly protein PilN
MDLNKEIKLSDLFRRNKGAEAESAPKEERPPKEPKARKSFSFSLGSKEPKEPKAPKEPKEKKEKVTSAKSAPPPPAVPLMRAFDLMPKESAAEKGRSGASPQLVKVGIALLAIVVLAGLAGAYMMFDANAKEKQSQADDLRAQLAEVTAQQAPDAGQGAATLAGESQARTLALSEALTARVAWDRILREFSLVLPEDVWLTTLQSTSGTATTATVPTTPAPAVGGGTFTINGFARNQADVALLLSRLAVVPEFSDVRLTSSSRGGSTGEGGTATADNPTDYSFAIVATITPQGVPAS